MKTLQEYEKIALKIIGKAGSSKYLGVVSDDLIGQVIYAIAKADSTYKKERKLSPFRWRRYYAICYIKMYVKEYKKRKKLQPLSSYNDVSLQPVEYNDVAGRKVDFLIRNSGLTKKQRSFIEKYLEYGSITTASSMVGISYQEASSLWEMAIKKMKRVT